MLVSRNTIMCFLQARKSIYIAISIQERPQMSDHPRSFYRNDRSYEKRKIRNEYKTKKSNHPSTSSGQAKFSARIIRKPAIRIFLPFLMLPFLSESARFRNPAGGHCHFLHTTHTEFESINS